MPRINKILALGLLMMVVYIAGHVLGERGAIYQITKDCDYLEKFRIGNKVWICKTEPIFKK